MNSDIDTGLSPLSPPARSRPASPPPSTPSRGDPRDRPDLFASGPADGAHEVLVNAPEHVVSLAELSEERFGTAVSFWRERMRAFADESAYVHLIVNEGPEAGASREHTHAQLYALGSSPRRSPASASG